MKKISLVLVLALVLGGAAFAQESANFTSPLPQFIAFNLGAGFGYAVSDTATYGIGADQMGGIVNFGFSISVIQNFGVGFDSLQSSAVGGGASTNLFSGLRLSYNFIPQAGAAIGIGGTNLSNAATTGITLGLYGDLFQNRSPSGITSGLKIRIDYVAATDDIAKGVIVFAPAFSFGL